MGELRPWHIAVLVVVLILLFGAKRLPDAARSLGRSMRILKAETKGLADDGRGDGRDSGAGDGRDGGHDGGGPRESGRREEPTSPALDPGRPVAPEPDQARRARDYDAT